MLLKDYATMKIAAAHGRGSGHPAHRNQLANGRSIGRVLRGADGRVQLIFRENAIVIGRGRGRDANVVGLSD